MKYISLFSGIESVSCAAILQGHKPVVFSEIDPFCNAVLSYRFPDVVNVGDIRDVKWQDYKGCADLVIGGSPCQSFSVAGARRGVDDDRGQLCFEFLRAAKAIDPEWVVFENVCGFLSADKRQAMRRFLETVAQLWSCGGAAWRVLDAQYFGIPQRRRRLFIVINTRDWRRASAAMLATATSREFAEAWQSNKSDITAAIRANTYKVQSLPESLATVAFCQQNLFRHAGKHAYDVNQPLHTLTTFRQAPVVCMLSGDDVLQVRTMTPTELERAQGFPDNWTEVPFNGRSAAKAPVGNRYKAIGNAMAVPVISEILSRIEYVNELVKKGVFI